MRIKAKKDDSKEVIMVEETGKTLLSQIEANLKGATQAVEQLGKKITILKENEDSFDHPEYLTYDNNIYKRVLVHAAKELKAINADFNEAVIVEDLTNRSFDRIVNRCREYNSLCRLVFTKDNGEERTVTGTIVSIGLSNVQMINLFIEAGIETHSDGSSNSWTTIISDNIKSISVNGTTYKRK